VDDHSQVILSLSTRRKNRKGADVQLHSFLTSALDGVEWSNSGPRCFAPEDLRYTLNRRIGKSKSRYFEKHKKFLAPTGIRAPDRLGHRLITIPTGLYRIPLKCPCGTCGCHGFLVSPFHHCSTFAILSSGGRRPWARDRP
jgi:hypothetical protein